MPSEPIFSRTGVVLLPDYDPTTTFEVSGIVDKLDVTVVNGDALLQFRTVRREAWLPPDGIGLRNGLFQSLTGVSVVHAEDGGADAFRLKRAAGVADSRADVRAWLR